MKRTYVFDALGTTIPKIVEYDLNELFFDKYDQLGYTPEQLGLLYRHYQENPRDPEFLCASAGGKKILLQQGFYQVTFFPDVKSAFEKIRQTDRMITIFSKDSTEIIAELYRQGGLLELIGEENIVSSANFRVPDQCDPRSYLELAEHLAAQRCLISSYTSDDPAKVIAFKKTLARVPGYIINREGTIIESAPSVVRSLEEVVR